MIMIRTATKDDLHALAAVYASARSYMCQTGNPTQWAGGYPAEALLLQDIAQQRLYVLEEAGRICAAFMLCAGPDATYAHIEKGSWAKEAPYGVLHRVASDGTVRGVVAACVAFAARRYDYLRIDTHARNTPMQKALAREGFTCRGIIYTHDGTPRLAYDR